MITMVNFMIFSQFKKKQYEEHTYWHKTLTVCFTNATLLPVITQPTNDFICLIITYQASSEASHCALVLEI